MKIDVLTLFPEMFSALDSSLIGKARQKGLFELTCHNIRDYSTDKHKKCDDSPFGGGAGMVMMPQPIHDCIASVDPNHTALRIYLSPRGKTLKQSLVKELSQQEHLLLLCGHYEGVDQRVLDMDIDMELSVGDYVLSGGELPAMVVIDSVLRYVPNVLGNEESTVDESFSDSLLEYPQYTRPQDFLGMQVPEVLVGGNHQCIDKWRKEQSIAITKKNRPDLLTRNKDGD
ncbi:MAG: tRNA (guanosine(37)-N1)-methyltransferase TrmD [Corallococcus sp.]|nr:tRNA (guanosine(37)-N1)-methyltransferase TrmD [Corallococcus sp.]MCM1359471.1 tRNA (guanosine(37)-N1)-methyltransferase TrmD [Corallococcus sp.]MCM1394717.1 tRNA (guanosine(37)-N1)-methyltransferase TrmD [Corallococcus sp.]